VRVAQSESIEVWEAGLYRAIVHDVVETVSTYPGSEGKPRLRFVFRVAAESGDYTDVWYFTGATLSRHPAATLRPTVAALRPDLDLDDPELALDTGHPEGQQPDRDDALIGARCRVILGVNEEKGRNVVEKVLPAESEQKASGPRRPSPAANGAKAPF